MKLYQIENSIHELLSKEDLSLEDLEQSIILDDSLHNKLDDMLAYQQEQEQTLTAHESYLKDKLHRIKQAKLKNDNIKEFIKNKLMQYDIKELKSRHFLSVKVAACGCKPIIINPDYPIENIPDAFKKISVEISKTAIKEALNDGEILEFASLGEQTKSIKIKG